jgi:hypothetical protein
MARPPLQLGDFLPEQCQITLNGVTYTAWVTTNGRYPRSAMARLDRARRRYRRAIEPALPLDPDELADMSPEERAARLAEHEEALDNAQVAWNDYLTESLLILVEGLDETTAEMIPIDTARDVLTDPLGYLAPPTAEAVAEAESEEASTEEPAPLIGATSPEGSQTSTPATTTPSS